jgi:hypothetical protein
VTVVRVLVEAGQRSWGDGWCRSGRRRRAASSRSGQPGAIFRDRDGKVLNTLALDILDGRIQTIRSVINPDKLRHVGPVADAWAVAREANQACRPTD